MADDFEYVSRSRLEFRDGYRRAYLGEVPDSSVHNALSPSVMMNGTRPARVGRTLWPNWRAIS